MVSREDLSKISTPKWRRKWQPTPVLPGKLHGQRSQVSYRPWGHKEQAMTEQLSPSTPKSVCSFEFFFFFFFCLVGGVTKGKVLTGRARLKIQRNEKS